MKKRVEHDIVIKTEEPSIKVTHSEVALHNLKEHLLQ